MLSSPAFFSSQHRVRPCGDGYTESIPFLMNFNDLFFQNPESAPGRIITLSGKTGLPLGHYLELPGRPEISIPAVKYVTNTGAVYILFGTGGETTSGWFLLFLCSIFEKISCVSIFQILPEKVFDNRINLNTFLLKFA